MFGQKNNHRKFLLVIAFLSTVSHLLSANTQKLVDAKRINPRDTQLVVRSAVVAGGTINLLENAGQSSIRGINDFDGNQLTNGRNFVLTDITINYGTAADDTSAALVDYTTALPVALKTANIVIKQNEEVIRRFSIAAINEAKSTDHRFHELQAFVLLVDQTTTSIEIEFAAGTALGAGAGVTGYVECILDGFETKVKS